MKRKNELDDSLIVGHSTTRLICLDQRYVALKKAKNTVAEWYEA